MRIGILTFHWASNYGAVLQAYALQQYLACEKGYKVEIINYYPSKFQKSFIRALRPSYPAVIRMRLSEYRKEKHISPFRNKLKLTKYYSKYKAIDVSNYDILICGSDQVWNPSFAETGEDEFTPAYFLPFDSGCKKIAYSVSLGCTKYPALLFDKLKTFIDDFSAIGMREESGVALLKEAGIKNVHRTCDPTLLVDFDQISNLISDTKNIKFPNGYVGMFMLRNQDVKWKNFAQSCADALGYKKEYSFEAGFVEEWLEFIRDSEFLITNSFHAVVMAIKFHVKFAVVLGEAEYNGMDDRFFTLLSEVGLLEHIIKENCQQEVERVLALSPCWASVDKKLKQIRQESGAFLESVLS